MYLGAARKKAGYTQASAAAATGIPLGTIRRWEQGVNEPDIDSLVVLAKLYGVTTDTLLGTQFADPKVTDDPRIVRAVPSPARQIPVIGAVAAGEACEAIEQADRTFPWPEELCGGGDYAWVQASGNSMNRDFADRALVLIDRRAEVHNGDIAAVYVNGDDVTIKQVFFEEGGAIRLHPRSYDPEYRDRVIDASDPDAPEVRFLGKAVTYTAPPDWRP